MIEDSIFLPVSTRNVLVVLSLKISWGWKKTHQDTLVPTDSWSDVKAKLSEHDVPGMPDAHSGVWPRSLCLLDTPEAQSWGTTARE